MLSFVSCSLDTKQENPKDNSNIHPDSITSPPVDDNLGNEILPCSVVSPIINCTAIPEHLGENPMTFKLPDYVPIEKDFAIVFDAGSTSTRVHVYEFYVSNGVAFDIDADNFFYVKQPLSNFLDKLDRIEPDIIMPLMNFSLNAIKNYRPSRDIPIVFHATAGLRKLNEGADLILNTVRNALSKYIVDEKYKDYHFKFFKNPETAVSLLTGKDEGIYAWLAVNFVMNRIGNLAINQSTMAIMDLGGASVQLVFEVDQTKELLYFKESAKASNFSENHPYVEFSYNGKNHVLFQRSVMMGLMEARRIAKQNTAESSANNYIQRFTSSDASKFDGEFLHQRFGCYNWNDSEEIYIEEKVSPIFHFMKENYSQSPPIPVNTIIGTLDTSYNTCKSHVLGIFGTVLNVSIPSNESSIQEPFLYSEFFPGAPKDPLSGHFIANALKEDFFVFSFFADRLKEIFPDHSSECTVGTFSTLTMSCNNTLCDEFDQEARETCLKTLGSNQDFCLDSVYLYSLLKDGCGLDDNTPLLVAHHIENVGICWPLGSALLMIDRD